VTAEIDEEIPTETDVPGLRPEIVETLRQGLQEAVDKLQEVLNQLRPAAP
jgi:hypothetical protein